MLHARSLLSPLFQLPHQLAKILVGVVVLSMALTPYLAKLGDYLGKQLEEQERRDEYQQALDTGQCQWPIVVVVVVVVVAKKS